MTEAPRAGITYFAVVFGAGFVLGVVRVLAVVPRLGERSAELLEMPVMFAVTIAAARWTVRRMAAPTRAQLLAVGAIALGLLVAAELAMVVFVRNLTVREYLASRDPVSGGAFLLLLGLFGAMPLLVGVTRRRRPS